MATGIRRHPALLTIAASRSWLPGRSWRLPASSGRRTPRAGAASCWRSSPPSRRASTPTRRAPSPTSSWWRRSTARCCSSTRPNFQKIIGDLATEWKIAPDGLTYTFKIRQGVRFHDGSPLTATDVKASYDKIVSPPPGVGSFRKNTFSAVERVDAPDPTTVVFKLKFPSASLLANLASPWNVIYPKKYLDQDPNYFKTHVLGSGPFKFKSYVHGSTLEGERNPDYFIKDRPYLDGYKFFISTETSVRAAAIRSGRAYIEFRDLPPAEVEAIKKQLGDKVVVQETPVSAHWGICAQQHHQAVQRRPGPQGADAGASTGTR